MRRVFRVAAILAVLVAASRATETEGGEIIYSIQNYPADQEGATLSGTTTSDGVTGTLAQCDILSWSWTITPPGGAPFTLTSSEAGARLFLEGSIVASQTTIAVAPPPSGGVYAFALDATVGQEVIADLEYDRFFQVGGTPVNSYFGLIPSGGNVWSTNPSVGITQPWVVATAAVPEPSSVACAPGVGGDFIGWPGCGEKTWQSDLIAHARRRTSVRRQ
jgi:hypothetical protein